jgi:hypothetical protein
MSLTVGDAPFTQPGEIDRAIAAAAERKRAREAAARAMGFASYAAYHLQRWHHEGWRISDMAEECGVSQSAIREGGRELSASRRSPPGKLAVPATRTSATRSTEDRRLRLSGSLSHPLRQ